MREPPSVGISRWSPVHHPYGLSIAIAAIVIAFTGLAARAADALPRKITIQEKGMARADSDPKGMVYLDFVRRPSPAQLG